MGTTIGSLGVSPTDGPTLIGGLLTGTLAFTGTSFASGVAVVTASGYFSFGGEGEHVLCSLRNDGVIALETNHRIHAGGGESTVIPVHFPFSITRTFTLTNGGPHKITLVCSPFSANSFLLTVLGVEISAIAVRNGY